jgi:hypothetical protein
MPHTHTHTHIHIQFLLTAKHEEAAMSFSFRVRRDDVGWFVESADGSWRTLSYRTRDAANAIRDKVSTYGRSAYGLTLPGMIPAGVRDPRD